jgi:RimJ/RimL family protein N-acetyltransferase
MQPTPSTVRLREADRASLELHFLALDRDDRRLRFGAPIADEGVQEYAARIDFDHDRIFAVHDQNLEVVAAIHLAFTGEAVELGLSVLQGWRGEGLGNALFKRATTYLRNRGYKEVFVHCLSENAAMMHLARKHGMRIVYSGGETGARLALAPATPESRLTEWVDEQHGVSVRALRQNLRFAQTLFGLKPQSL